MARIILTLVLCSTLIGCRDSSSPVGTWTPSAKETFLSSGQPVPAGMDMPAIEKVANDFGKLSLKLRGDHTFSMESETKLGGVTQSSSTTSGRWEQQGDQIILTGQVPSGVIGKAEPDTIQLMTFRFVDGKLRSQASDDPSKAIFGVWIRS